MYEGLVSTTSQPSDAALYSGEYDPSDEAEAVRINKRDSVDDGDLTSIERDILDDLAGYDLGGIIGRDAS